MATLLLQALAGGRPLPSERLFTFRLSRSRASALRDDRPRAAELGLPPMLEELTRLPSGLILVTGPTGRQDDDSQLHDRMINRNRRAKIVTIEDPVEFVHENLRSIVVQQEVQTDVAPSARPWSTSSARTPTSS